VVPSSVPRGNHLRKSAHLREPANDVFDAQRGGGCKGNAASRAVRMLVIHQRRCGPDKIFDQMDMFRRLMCG
jgi:hypothetical protein